MDKCPDLKVCLAPTLVRMTGGYTCFGAGRMDRGWQVRPCLYKCGARTHIQQPPSAYLDKFYYDCLTPVSIQMREPALRMLIDSVGIDRVIFGPHAHTGAVYKRDGLRIWP